MKLINGKELKKEVFQTLNKRGDKKMNDNSEIKRHLIDYVHEITTKSKGRNQYICPICGSGTGNNHTGAFTFYPENNKYYCFSCQASGDIFSLYAEINHLDIKKDFQQIKTELEEKYSVFSNIPQKKNEDKADKALPDTESLGRSKKRQKSRHTSLYRSRNYFDAYDNRYLWRFFTVADNIDHIRR